MQEIASAKIKITTLQSELARFQNNEVAKRGELQHVEEDIAAKILDSTTKKEELRLIHENINILNEQVSAQRDIVVGNSGAIATMIMQENLKNDREKLYGAAKAEKP